MVFIRVRGELELCSAHWPAVSLIAAEHLERLRKRPSSSPQITLIEMSDETMVHYALRNGSATYRVCEPYLVDYQAKVVLAHVIEAVWA